MTQVTSGNFKILKALFQKELRLKKGLILKNFFKPKRQMEALKKTN